MAPKSSRDFLRAAAQRLAAANVLYRETLNLDAQYIGGYTVECALKALILDRTPANQQVETLQNITRGANWHRAETLLGKLRELGVTLPPQLARRMRQFDWTTNLRYETGRADTGETRALLKTAELIYTWVRDQMP